ncbi:MAG: monovalent cation/H+ antiporter subunit D family protein [Deltaproteobacteria bacterium]|jgi:multicomponent Na+:H+ antiporter subunit D|nr:monovalent cation/H+ antiporter subunit D family protein [Deltaproteobacteria bacterium]
MNFIEQSPALLVVIPLLSALLVNMAGWVNRRYCYTFALLGVLGSFIASCMTLMKVMDTGVISYRLGGWPPPFGIEYVVDHLNGLVLVTVSFISLLAIVFSKESLKKELPDKASQFYTLFVLLVTGLQGMTITGDAFNLYVLLEISALTGYALIAMGDNRALVASFNYVILGTIGASFYLLGVGHLYIMTGSLNMADLLTILPKLYTLNAVFIALLLILIGAWIKMAFFPMHGWLPNAYTYAPSAAGCLVAPLVTKVSVYIMIRIMLSVFSPLYVYKIGVSETIVWMAVIAIISGSVLALAQTDFKKMLTYLIVAEVGYMVGGAWLVSSNGLTGAILHIVNDALMTLCLFIFAGIVIYKKGGQQLQDLAGLYKKMPVTMTAFTVGALSMIGVPPTAGFFSKWYLILGAIDAGRYHFMAALLLSSLVNVILFFRVIEIAFFEPKVDHHEEHSEKIFIDEAPFSMLVPLVIVALCLIIVGLYSGDIVTNIIQHSIPEGLDKLRL